MSQPLLSQRIDGVQGAPNVWDRARAALWESGGQRWDMTVSNPTAVGLVWDSRGVAESLSRSLTAYAPHSLGSSRAREAIAQHLSQPSTVNEYGFVDSARCATYDANCMMLTASTSESYAYLFKLLCDPGDYIAVPEPSYPLLEHLAALESLRVVKYRLDYDGSWYVDWDSVRTALSARPKVIILVSPNNPTASCFTDDEFRELRSHGVPLILDQVFAPFTLATAGVKALPLAEEEGLVFALDGLSKRCGLPQLKLGWLSVFGQKRSSASAMSGLGAIGDTYLGVNGLVESAAGTLLGETQGVRLAICERLAANRTHLIDLVRAGAPFSLLNYHGGWSALLRLPNYGAEEDWAVQLLGVGVIVHPGWLYDCHLPATIVVSLLTPEDVFRNGMRRVVQMISDASCPHS